MQQMVTEHIQLGIKWESDRTAPRWHGTGMWPLCAHRQNTTGCIVWIRSVLYLPIFLSGKAWRINPHSMDFPTSSTIHSQSARSLLSCTTRCLLSASAFKWFLPLKWHLYHCRIKAFRSSLLFVRFLSCTNLISACRGDSQWHLKVAFPLDSCLNPCSSKNSCHLSVAKRCVWRLSSHAQSCRMSQKHWRAARSL